jgi:hypothetical protein
MILTEERRSITIGTGRRRKIHAHLLANPLPDLGTQRALRSDSAGCVAAIAVRPDGLVPLDRMVAITESRHRSVNSAETAIYSLVINAIAVTN